MAIEGEVAVKLDCSGGRIDRVQVVSQRPDHARTLLLNRSPEQAVTLVGSVFRICANAQMQAAVTAIEQCQRIDADPDTKVARQQRVAMETLREHSWRVFLNWPTLVGEPPCKAPLKALLEIDRQWQQLFGSNAFISAANPELPTVAAQRDCLTALGELLETELFGIDPLLWQQMAMATFEKWLADGQTLAARVLGEIHRRHWSATGNTPTRHLTAIDRATAHRLLTGDGADRFIRQPDLQGQCHESTPLSRQQYHPLIRSLTARFGTGLLTRMTALLIEIAAMFEAMDSPRPITGSAGSGLPAGLGVVNAARGLLIHRVELQAGRVADYQIVAPTEWNFHPQGTLARALHTLEANDRTALKQQAGLLIEAMDPCVGYTLEIGHA